MMVYRWFQIVGVATEIDQTTVAVRTCLAIYSRRLAWGLIEDNSAVTLSSSG